MYKLICFDLDGTLLDTVPDIQTVLNSTLKHFSLPGVTYAQTCAYVGNGAFKLVERAAGNIGKELLQEVYAYYTAHFAACDNSLSAYYPYEEEVLSRLTERGVKLAIITNKPQAATLNVYRRYFKKYNFAYVQGQEEGAPLKPDPSCVFKAIKEAGVKPSETLFVGDGETDVLTALNAKIDGVSVLWGYRSRAELEKAGAKIFVGDFRELENFIFNKIFR